MDFNVNVKFDVTPALVGAVATLATALSGCAAPQVQKTMVVEAPVSFTPLPEQPKMDAPTPAAPAVQSPVVETQPSTDISDTVVREAVAAKAKATKEKAGKKAEIKELLAEFGVKSSPELPQERRAEFIQKINAL